MKREQQTWYCHTVRCGYTTTQSVSIKSVSHACGKGRHVRALKLTAPKESK